MKKDNQLIDELLKEHARKGSGADEEFLEDLERKLDHGNTGAQALGQSGGSRWALGLGMAACLTVGVTGVYFWQNAQKNKDIIAYQNVEVTPEQHELIASPRAASAPESRLDRGAPATQNQSSAAMPGDKGANNPTIEAGAKDTRQKAVEEFADIPAASANASPEAHLAKPADLSTDRSGDSVFGQRMEKSNAEALGLEEPKPRMLAENIGGAGGAYPMKAKDGMQHMRHPIHPIHPPIICPPPFPIPPAPPVVPPVVQQPTGERYGELIDNKFTAPTDERSALSTFAVDVDTASYSNVRRMITQGQQIPKDAVRIEEMINYFDYHYPQPTGIHPFSVHVDSMACPWEPEHRIVRIGLQGKQIVRSERPAANIVFLLDVSGSMNSEDKLPLLKRSMTYLLEELNEKDTVSIVVYAGSSGLTLPPTKVDDAGRQKIQEAMLNLSAGGSTAGGAGIKLAYATAKENFVKGGVNRIILATDGDFNVGVADTDSLTKLVKEKAKEGTFISVLGFGQGNVNDEMMEAITNHGNGNYFYIDSVAEGRKVLLEDMMGTMVTIAKDVKVQVVMNPSQVKAYRLIGYSNRMLPPEAFLDKKVDAGEIGAGHRVTALYEIIPADGTPFGPQIDASRYFNKAENAPKPPALKDSKEMLFVKLAYKLPDQKTEDDSTYLSMPFTDGQSEASADLKFASAVAVFGMVLRESEHKGNGTLEMAEILAKEGVGTDGKGHRVEFTKLIQKLRSKE